MPNADEVVNDIMYRYGWIKEPALKKGTGRKRYTVQEFAELKPEGTYVIRCFHHWTVVSNGNIIDICDTGRAAAGIYYKKQL